MMNHDARVAMFLLRDENSKLRCHYKEAQAGKDNYFEYYEKMIEENERLVKENQRLRDVIEMERIFYSDYGRTLSESYRKRAETVERFLDEFYIMLMPYRKSWSWVENLLQAVDEFYSKENE